MEPDLNELGQRLKLYGLTKFVIENFDYLYENTQATEFARNLKAKRLLLPSQAESCLSLPCERDRNEQIYTIIGRKGKCVETLEALNASNNDHIITYIQETLEQLPSVNPPVRGGGGMDPVQNMAPNNEEYLNGVITRLQEYVERNRQYYDLPLQEFFREHIAELYSKTGEGLEDFITKLRENGVLTENMIELIRAETTTSARCERVYRRISQQEAIREMIISLDRSNNRHVIRLIDSWL